MLIRCVFYQVLERGPPTYHQVVLGMLCSLMRLADFSSPAMRHFQNDALKTIAKYLKVKILFWEKKETASPSPSPSNKSSNETKLRMSRILEAFIDLLVSLFCLAHQYYYRLLSCSCTFFRCKRCNVL